MAPVSLWDLNGDKRAMKKRQLIVPRSILEMQKVRESRNFISVKGIALFVVRRSPDIDPKLIEEGKCVGVDCPSS